MYLAWPCVQEWELLHRSAKQLAAGMQAMVGPKPGGSTPLAMQTTQHPGSASPHSQEVQATQPLSEAGLGNQGTQGSQQLGEAGLTCHAEQQPQLQGQQAAATDIAQHSMASPMDLLHPDNFAAPGGA